MKVFYYLILGLIAIPVFPQANSVVVKNSSGTVTGSYNSISDAYNSLPDSVIQSYFIEIQRSYLSSHETFPIILNYKAGTSDTIGITIRPAGEVSITAMIANDAVIEFNGSHFVTIDGRVNGTGATNSLTIENTFTSGPETNTIEVKGNSKNNTIRYCNVNGFTQGEYWNPGTITIKGNPGQSNPHYNTVENCFIKGGACGIKFEGFSKSSNNLVINCIIENFSATGIFLKDTRSARVLNNTIRQTTPYGSGVRGITVTGGDTTLISCNKILNLQAFSGSVAGIYVLIPLVVIHTTIVNNFISLYAANKEVENVHGIIYAGNNDWGQFTSHIVVYNTIYLGGQYTGTADTVQSACLYRSSISPYPHFWVRNNIFINKRRGGNVYAVHSGSIYKSMEGTLDYNFNLYYASGDSNSYCAGWGSTFYNNLEQYQAAAYPNESVSVFRDVAFVADDDLHLTMASWKDSLLKAGYANQYHKDIDDEQRVFNYKGADEIPNTIPVELISFSAQLSGTVVILKWATATELNNHRFDIERKTSGSWKVVGIIAGNGSSSEKNTYSFEDYTTELERSGKLYYRLKQVDYNNNFNFSEEIELTFEPGFSLFQNFPNPFNPVTTIVYSVARPENIRLIVYDLLGRELAILIDEEKLPGNYKIDFNASDLASGIYFYRLIFSDQSISQKMMVLK